MWQYSSKGKVNGISGGVDMNYCYIDYPALINNVSYETDNFKPVNEITPEVMTGKWKKNKNGWWYEYNDGTYPKDQWLKLEGSWYYFKPNGYAVCDDWYNVKDKWYYFDDTCRMVTGLRQIGDETYYFADDGHMCRTNNRGALV
jgi:hypothetical protein